MATTKGENVFSEALAPLDEPSLIPPSPPIPPDPPDPLKQNRPPVNDLSASNMESPLAKPVTTTCSEKDSGVGSPSTPGAGTPIKPSVETRNYIPKGDERILFVDSLPSEFNCAQFFGIFGKYGIKLIKF